LPGLNIGGFDSDGAQFGASGHHFSGFAT